jgi:tRNA-Thr(GGU) m(6)t(6)A37 methyltransferase TsaA
MPTVVIYRRARNRQAYASHQTALRSTRRHTVKSSSVSFHPIGVIRSVHIDPNTTPIQPIYAKDSPGRLEVLPKFAEGLDDIEGFSHIYLIYHLHRAHAPQLRVKPFLQDAEHGIFATRSPCRPNPLGLSLVRLLRREGNILHLADVDMLDGTPVLDIKPYSTRFDRVENPRGGWTDDVSETEAQLRGRRDFKT